jgi:hypothetical protein
MDPEQQPTTREPFYLIASAGLWLAAGVVVLLHTVNRWPAGWFDYAMIGSLLVLAVGGVVLYFRSGSPPQA